MMRPRHLLVAAVLVGLGACSALRPEPSLERDAAHRLDRGLAALDGERYREAFHDLAWVYTHCPGRARGAEALVALAALELDPRNRAGRPGVGTDLLARGIRGPTPPDYVRPIMATTYLMARALGAPDAAEDAGGPPRSHGEEAPSPSPGASGGDREIVRAAEILEPLAREPAHGCGAAVAAEGWVAPRLPELPGPTLVSLLAAAEAARDTSRAQAASLREQLAATRARLAETEAELERIRRTLRP